MISIDDIANKAGKLVSWAYSNNYITALIVILIFIGIVLVWKL